jgi:hypothetical protein
MKAETPWRTDEHGMLLGISYHDSYLSKLTFSEDSGLELEMRSADGERVALELSGLRHLNIVSLWNVPIVAYIFVWKLGAVPESRWRVPDCAWNLLFADQIGLIEKRKAAAARIVQKSPDALLVDVSCSYGGSLAAVCDGIAAFKFKP